MESVIFDASYLSCSQRNFASDAGTSTKVNDVSWLIDSHWENWVKKEIGEAILGFGVETPVEFPLQGGVQGIIFSHGRSGYVLQRLKRIRSSESVKYSK
jgi:hypothetical protein